MAKSEANTTFRRGLRILEAVAQSEGGMTFNQLKEQLGESSPATLTRFLKMLQEDSLLEKKAESRLYRLGEAARKLGAVLQGEKPSRGELIRPALQQLAEEVGASAAYFELEGLVAVLESKYELAEAFHYMAEKGENRNFTKHAFAQLLWAHASEEKSKRIFWSLALSQKEERAMSRKLKKLREMKVWTNREDDQSGIIRAVAPVFYPEGDTLCGVIGVTLFHGTDEATIESRVGESADKIKNLLLK